MVLPWGHSKVAVGVSRPGGLGAEILGGTVGYSGAWAPPSPVTGRHPRACDDGIGGAGSAVDG